MPLYHVTYSAQIDGGIATGRCFLRPVYELDTEARVMEVEQLVLDDLRKTQPTARNIFLTNWKRLKG